MCLAPLSSCHLSKRQYPGSVQKANSLALKVRGGMLSLNYVIEHAKLIRGKQKSIGEIQKIKVLGYYTVLKLIYKLFPKCIFTSF